MNPVTHVVSKFLHNVHTKQLATLQRQTQQLDPERRDYLRTVLRQSGHSNSNTTWADHPLDDHRSREEEDVEEQTTTTTQKEQEETPPPENDTITTMMRGRVNTLQREIMTAVEQQQALAARRSFLQTRLAVYERKLRGLEHPSGGGRHRRNTIINTATHTRTNSNSNFTTTTKNTPQTEEQEHLLYHNTIRHRRPRDPNSDEDEDEDKSDNDDAEKEQDDNPTTRQRQTQLASYRRALRPIHAMLTTLDTEWHTNQRKLEALHVRHWDLHVKTEECDIVWHELFSRTNEEHSLDPNNNNNNNNDNDNHDHDNSNYNTEANTKMYDRALHDENPTTETTTTRASTTYTDTKCGDHPGGNNSIRTNKSYASDAEYNTNDGVVFPDLELV